jgi:virginiamycin B lyase
VSDAGTSTNVKGPSITLTEFAIPTASNPGAITAGPDGNIWFTHQSTAPSAIGRLATSGASFMVFKTTVTNTGPVAIVGGPDGNVWYTKQAGIGRMTPSGTFNEYGVPGGGDSGGITNGPDGNLWFTEPHGNKIAHITPAGSFTEFKVPTAASGPAAIAVGPDGNLWFTEAAAASNKIGRMTPAGAFMEFPIPTAASNAGAIVKGPDGNLWFTEHDAHKIGRITPAGAVTEFALSSLGSPGSIAAGPDGNLWFTEAGTVNSIGRVTPAGGIAEYPIPTPDSDPAGITVGPDMNLWFTELSANKIGRLSNLAGGGTLNSGTGGAGSTPMLGMPCTNDTDCVGTGKACGGDVCSSKEHVCVLANSGDPGTCASDAKCWCAGEGATCDAAKHACTFIVHGGAASF